MFVTEPKEYENIIQTVSEAMTYESALKYLETFSSQFRDAEGKDVIIENASLDSALAVNKLIKAGKKVGVITGGKDKTDFIVSYEDYKSIADQYILSAYGVDGTNIKAKLIGKSPVVYVPGPWTPNDSGYSGFSDWSYKYNFDSFAVSRLGFDVTKDVTKSDAIVGQNNLKENEIAEVKAGKPYMAIGNTYRARSGIKSQVLSVTGSGKAGKCINGIDFMGYVEYPENTMVNGSYAKEGDYINYQYGTYYYKELPEGAKAIVKNAGKNPLQGYISLSNSDKEKEFKEYNSSPVAFEYKAKGMDIVAFANTLTYKEHYTDEFLFISNFLFSRMMTDKEYKSVKPIPDIDNGKKPGEEDTSTEAKTYYFVDGDKIVWAQADKKDLKATVKSNKDDKDTFKKFKGLQLDGELIDSANYVATEGSVNITLKADYLSKISVGEHNLTAVFADGKAVTKLKFAESEKTLVKATNTGDKANLYIWLALVIAAVAVVTVIILYKRKK
ncbi:hypothetical protein ACGCUQ_00185 [Eubacteriales bacterium KG127]